MNRKGKFVATLACAYCIGQSALACDWLRNPKSCLPSHPTDPPKIPLPQLPPIFARNCPGGWYKDAHLGVCLPEIPIPTGAACLTPQGLAAAESLESMINASRASSRNGSQPIPPTIRAYLEGFVDEDILDRATYRVGDNGVLNLGGILTQLEVGGAAAVTLNDVIVFRSENDAENPQLWAHELTHVQQYRNSNVHDFACAYVTNWHEIEGPAYAREDAWAQWYSYHLLPGTPMTDCICSPGGPAAAQEPRCRSGAVAAYQCNTFQFQCPVAPIQYFCQ